MQRRETDALDFVDFVDALDQLHERTFPVYDRERAATVVGDDLAEKRDFAGAVGGELLDLADYFADWAAALGSACFGDDAEGAGHAAPLHDRDKRGHLPVVVDVVFDRVLRSGFGGD